MSNIIQCPSYEDVTVSFRKHQKEFSDTQSGLKLPRIKQKQLEVQYVLKKICIEYQQLFEKEARSTKQIITKYRSKNPSNFAEYMLENYKSIRGLYKRSYNTIPSQICFPDDLISDNHIQHAMDCIRYMQQKFFVVPSLNFIEKNYLQQLLENNVLPFPAENLLLAINNDQLDLKYFTQEVPEKSQYAVFSQRNNHLYYLEYNSFTDIHSYRQYLNEVYSQFEQYISDANQIITHQKERIKFYNKIKTKIDCSLNLYIGISDKQKGYHSLLPNFIRKDTLAQLKQYINDCFIPGQEVTFSPGLDDFQDLQYCMGKKALYQVESKINDLQFALKIDSMTLTPISNKATNLPDYKKIKTELTVNQIAFVIRCLHEEKGILDEPNKIAFCRKLSSILSSTRQENISAVSIKNKFTNYDDKTVEFWIEKFTHFIQFAKKIRENNFSGNI